MYLLNKLLLSTKLEPTLLLRFEMITLSKKRTVVKHLIPHLQVLLQDFKTECKHKV